MLQLARIAALKAKNKNPKTYFSCQVGDCHIYINQNSLLTAHILQCVPFLDIPALVSVVKCGSVRILVTCHQRWLKMYFKEIHHQGIIQKQDCALLTISIIKSCGEINVKNEFAESFIELSFL